MPLDERSLHSGWLSARQPANGQASNAIPFSPGNPLGINSLWILPLIRPVKNCAMPQSYVSNAAAPGRSTTTGQLSTRSPRTDQQRSASFVVRPQGRRLFPERQHEYPSVDLRVRELEVRGPFPIVSFRRTGQGWIEYVVVKSGSPMFSQNAEIQAASIEPEISAGPFEIVDDPVATQTQCSERQRQEKSRSREDSV